MQARHTSHKILMVAPTHFAFNPQTGADNEFQHHSALTAQQIQKRALAESAAMAELLKQKGVEVLVMDCPADDPHTPDAVFPNNWFSTSDSGQLFLYPMATANRQLEVKPVVLQQLLQASGSLTEEVVDVRHFPPVGQHLEGTGVLVFDHVQNTAYAALSERCQADILTHYAQSRKLEVVSFDTCLPSGAPVYHTNVMMSIGEQFAVICSEVIVKQHRQRVLNKLQNKQLIDISLEQLNHFCGNVLQVENNQGEKLIAMSQTAFDAFSAEQKQQLQQHGELLPIAIPTIENIGGGSVRCMMAEIFY